MTKTNTLRVVSYGGGIQSTALLVLAAEGRIDYRTFIMANVGDDSEHPKTLEFVRGPAAEYARDHGIDLHVLDRVKRTGEVETLYGRLTREGSRSLPIPVRMSNGAPGTRSCTADFKIKVTGKWLKQQGATKDNPATVAIGISLDEIHRANTRRVEPHERVVYPLIGIGDDTGLKLNRQDCVNIIARSELPVPPKSSCYFCPFHRPQAWADMRRNEPELFEKSAQLEDTLNERRRLRGKDEVFLTRFGVPLRDAIADENHVPLFELDEGCDSGWCMT